MSHLAPEQISDSFDVPIYFYRRAKVSDFIIPQTPFLRDSCIIINFVLKYVCLLLFYSAFIFE